jgi:hypothetical protein
MIFRRAIHNQVLQVLQSLNRNFLESCQVYFGGGTLLTLCYGEYRLSRDIDFLCSYGEAFSRLRIALYDHCYDALFDRSKLDGIQLPRELRADRDGVRFAGLDQLAIQFGLSLTERNLAEGRSPLAD